MLIADLGDFAATAADTDSHHVALMMETNDKDNCATKTSSYHVHAYQDYREF